MEITEQEIQKYNNTIEVLDEQIKRLTKVVSELQQTRNYLANARDNAMSARPFYLSGTLMSREVTDLVDFIISNPKTSKEDLQRKYQHLSKDELNYLIKRAKKYWVYIENSGLRNTLSVKAPLLFQPYNPEKEN